MLALRPWFLALVALVCVVGTAHAHASLTDSLLNGMRNSIALVWQKATGVADKAWPVPFLDETLDTPAVSDVLPDSAPEWMLKGTEMVDGVLCTCLARLTQSKNSPTPHSPSTSCVSRARTARHSVTPT